MAITQNVLLATLACMGLGWGLYVIFGLWGTPLPL